jgi:hypothetical protein
VPLDVDGCTDSSFCSVWDHTISWLLRNQQIFVAFKFFCLLRACHNKQFSAKGGSSGGESGIVRLCVFLSVPDESLLVRDANCSQASGIGPFLTRIFCPPPLHISPQNDDVAHTHPPHLCRPNEFLNHSPSTLLENLHPSTQPPPRYSNHFEFDVNNSLLN